MFQVGSSEEGFVVSWPSEEAHRGLDFRRDLPLIGLSRARDWPLGTVVRRYRNQHETLDLLVGLLKQLGIEFQIDSAVEDLREARDRELEVFNRARSSTPSNLSPSVQEFAGGRQLLPYQVSAVGRHLHVRHSADFSVPGSGKTTVALAYWAHARRDTPNLGLWVVGPLSSFRPWEEEFGICFGRPPNSERVQGSAQQRARILRDSESREVLLSSYHTVWRDKDLVARALQRRPWLVVLDEAHYVKSMNGALAASVRDIAPFASRRLVLTGTPMPRSPEDLWSLFTFLWPSEVLLGNATQYALRCKQEPENLTTSLGRELRPFFHRTCKDDLGLPAVDSSYPLIPADALPRTQRLILRLVERRTLEELTYLNPRDRAHLKRWRRARIVRLMQAASNPLLLADSLDWAELALADEELPAPSQDTTEGLPLTDVDSALAAVLSKYQAGAEVPAKSAFIARRCRELVQSGEKVVIWTVFLGNVDLLARLLQDLDPLTITGQVPLYESEDDESGEATREQRVELFKSDPRRRVLIANMAACSESISLHRACQHALYLERSFNAAQFMQSLDRIHRQGMPAGKTAHVEIPSIPCAIERVINRRLRERQARLYRLLNDTMPVVGFDDDLHRGVFDVEDADDLDSLFAEVLAEIRTDLAKEVD